MTKLNNKNSVKGQRLTKNAKQKKICDFENFPIGNTQEDMKNCKKNETCMEYGS